MRTLVLLAMITPLVLIPACSHLTPTASPQRTLPPSPAPTATPVQPSPTTQPTPTSEPTSTPQPTVTLTPEPRPNPEPVEECEVESCEPYQEIALYHDFSDGQSFSRLVPGTNKTFIVKERRDGRMSIEVTEPSGAKWEAWADDNPGAYGPVGEAPPIPTPETPPAVVCTEPHWLERTPDRKTGYHFRDGNYRAQIYDPDTSPYAPYYNGACWTRLHIPGYDWIYRRDARIVSIDRQTGVIEFYVGSGVTVKRRFTQATRVVISAHEWYIGMPMSEAFRHRGNLCDLKVEDMASLLHPTLGEAQYLDPNLIDLWGVLIVQ